MFSDLLIKRVVAHGAAALFLALAGLHPVQAQSPEQTGAILVLNQERLLNQSLYGLRLQAELEVASAALAAQNRQIEEDLTEEEMELTELRPTMTLDDFRVLADEFDIRVTAIRAAQDAKARDLQSQAEAAQQRFFELSFPILLSVVEAQGAAVLLDSRTVLLSAEGVDITETALEAIDEGIGDGGEEPIITLPGLTDQDPAEGD